MKSYLLFSKWESWLFNQEKNHRHGDYANLAEMPHFSVREVYIFVSI